MERYDVVVVGAGVMGAAVARALSRLGQRPLVLERFSLNHPYGSSHGRTRIIRTLYAEGPEYVPWVRRAFRMWEELESEQRVELLHRTGCLMLGRPESASIRGARHTGRVLHLKHETLAPAQVRWRFPAFRPDANEVGLLDPAGGVLFAERCVAALVKSASENGAEFRFDTRVESWRETAEGVALTWDGADVRTKRLVLAPGAWVRGLVPALPFRPVIERQTVLWLQPRGADLEFGPDRMPVFTWQRGAGGFYYGVPDLGDGVKVAGYGGRRVLSADRVPRRVTPRDRRPVLAFVRDFLPEAAGPLRSETTCLFTYTPDGDFILDTVPDHPAVLLVSPCSGHGFKFAPAIGEAAAQLLIGQKSRLDRRRFRFDRFRPDRRRRIGPTRP